MEAWARCRDWLLPALRPGCATEADLVDDLMAGRAQIWPGERSAVVTQCVVDDRGPCLHVWLAGGDLEEILAMRVGAEAWARAQGCRRMTIDGRQGWARRLRAHGFARVGGQLERRL
jgi:hypothetical protein